MEYQWQLKAQADPQQAKALAQSLNINTYLSNLLIQRKITTFEQARQFFRPQLDDLHNPFLMADMTKAVDRLNQAINKQENILVYGDYDVDGTTAVALLYKFLSKYLQKLDYYIPDRYTEGYGISMQGIDYAAKQQTKLIIALDCGIKANKTIAYARQKNIDVIVCDHHTSGQELPPAIAVLDPKRKDCQYPYKELSGCAVGFKLLQAWCLHNKQPLDHLFSFLDIVAVSICSDIVPITGENRVLTRYGLEKLHKQPSTGLKAILTIAQLENKQPTVSDVVFAIGPRLNAAGRIASGQTAVKLMVCENYEQAWKIAQEVDKDNSTRKTLDQEITQQALEMIGQDPELENRKSTVVYHPHWHKGVIGIVASRLIEKHYRPTIVLTASENKISGSARSVEGFNLYEAIDACSDLLTSFGGHRYAAGLNLKAENLEAFKARFEEEVSRRITPEQLKPKLLIDIELPFSEITPKFYRILKQLSPFGPENMSPKFICRQVRDTGESRPVGQDDKHLKVDLRDTNHNRFSGIAFNLGHWASYIMSGKPVDICYSIEENTFNNKTRLQIRVRDFKASS